MIHVDEHECHMRECYKLVQNTGAILELPKEEAVMEFQNYKNMLVRPFMIYADCGSTVVKTNDPQKPAEHIQNSVALAVVCTLNPSRNYYKQFVGDDCVINLMLGLKCIAVDCIEEMKNNERMVMEEAD